MWLVVVVMPVEVVVVVVPPAAMVCGGGGCGSVALKGVDVEVIGSCHLCVRLAIAPTSAQLPPPLFVAAAGSIVGFEELD